MMLKRRVGEAYWFVAWCFTAPVIIIILLIYMTINSDIPIVNGKPLPHWAVVIGWIVFSSILIPIPIFAIYEVVKAFRNREMIRVKVFYICF